MSNKTEFVEVECCQCKKMFDKTIHRYKEAIKCGYKFFCNRSCANKFKVKRLSYNCCCCNKEISILQSSFDKSETKRFFCGHTCSAKFSNKARGPRTKETKQNIYDGIKRYYEGKGKQLYSNELPHH